MFSQRLITAIILVPITVALLFFLPPPAFAILSAFIALLGAFEWSNLMGVKNIYGRLFYLLLMALIFFMVLFISVQFIFVCTFIWWFFATLLIIFYPRCSSWWKNSIFWRGLMGVFTLMPCWVALNYIRSQNDGVYSLLFLFVLIWGADTAAYVFGKKWGKHKLAPQVSPGKTIEGLVGAILFAILFAVLAQWISQTPIKLWPLGVLLSLITVLFSVSGDLFESMLKRQAGLKDSGKLIPGHGGLLDRIDSLTSAAPIFTLGAIIMGTYLDNLN